MKENLVERIIMEKPDEFADLMTIEQWIGAVECGGFKDYDGFGFLCTEDTISNLRVIPSFVKNGIIKYVLIGFDPAEKIDESIIKQFTHIDWYNK